MSVAPQMSVAPKTQSVYNTNASYAATNPLSSFGQKAIQGKGITATKTSFRASTPTQSVFQSKATPTAPKVPYSQNKVIQGSGMTSSYANNPTNYKRSVPTVPTVTAPTPQKTMTPTDAYLQGMEKLSGQQTNFLNNQKLQREGSVKSKYQTLKEMISGQLPVAEENFDAYKKDSQADIEALRASGERQKGQAEDYYGEAQRDAAKTLNETQGQNQRTFAGLGTIDSRGEGSFQQATENTSSDFNRFTQQTLKAKADRFAEIDDTVSTAERQAQAALRQEAVKLEDLKKQIQFALINNDQAMADELSGIAQETEQNIMAIQEAVTGLKYQGALEKYNIELENSKLKAPDYDAESKLRGEYFTRTKDNKYNEVAQTYEKILNVPDTAAGDLGLIFSYMRLLDPSSTVREGEFANAQNAAGVPDQILNSYNKALTGQRLNPNQRQEFRSAALSYVEPVIKQQKQAEEYYRQLAMQQGIDPEKVVGGYGQIGAQTQSEGIDPAVMKYMQSVGM